jgi:adenylosuccinate lyase
VKRHGRSNDLIERIRRSKFFTPIHADLDTLLDPKTFIGRAPQQVEKFTKAGGEVATALKPYAHYLTTVEAADLKV